MTRPPAYVAACRRREEGNLGSALPAAKPRHREQGQQASAGQGERGGFRNGNGSWRHRRVWGAEDLEAAARASLPLDPKVGQIRRVAEAAGQTEAVFVRLAVGESRARAPGAIVTGPRADVFGVTIASVEAGHVVRGLALDERVGI